MNVKIAEPEKPEGPRYRDLVPGNWFAFADRPLLPCMRLTGGYVRYLVSAEHSETMIEDGVRLVIRLELASTKDQTLLLRRAE